MPGKKLIVESVWQQEHGGGTEYLSLVYEHSWGAGLAKNQLQFLADEINNGRIVLPPPARDDRPISEITREMADIMERDGFMRALVESAREALRVNAREAWSV